MLIYHNSDEIETNNTVDNMYIDNPTTYKKLNDHEKCPLTNVVSSMIIIVYCQCVPFYANSIAKLYMNV